MKVKCERCGWRGSAEELSAKYSSNPQDPSDIIPDEPCCPVCGSEFWDSIEINAGYSVVLGYPSGRRTKYLYNRVCSEAQPYLLTKGGENGEEN